jgi:hypothetical protein
VKELAADGIPVAVTCRVLKLARQPYYRWLVNSVSNAELARLTAPTLCLTPIATIRSSATGSWSPRPATPGSRWPSAPPGGSARTTAGGAPSASANRARTARSAHPCTTIWSAGTSPPMHQIGCGWPTLPNTAPAEASSICVRSRMCFPPASSATASILGSNPGWPPRLWPVQSLDAVTSPAVCFTATAGRSFGAENCARPRPLRHGRVDGSRRGGR